MGMDTVESVYEIFIKRREDRSAALVLAKVTDDLLFAGTSKDMKALVDAITKRFEISEDIIDGTILFNGCRIMRDKEGHIEMNTSDYTQSIDPLDVFRERRKLHDEKASMEEYITYRSLAGKIVRQWELPN